MRQGLLACEDCDLLHAPVDLPPGGHADCIRCGASLVRDRPRRTQECLALVMASMAFFVLANAYPLVVLELNGGTSSTTLWEATLTLYRERVYPVALLVGATTLAAPALELVAIAYILLPLELGRVPRGFRTVLRTIQAVRPWGMIEVFVLGTLVALVKLTHIAHVVPGVGLAAFGALILTLAAVSVLFDAPALWRQAEALGGLPDWRPAAASLAGVSRE